MLSKVMARCIYVIVDFFCMGLLELLGAQFENYKIKNQLPTAGLELTILGLRSHDRYR